MRIARVEADEVVDFKPRHSVWSDAVSRGHAHAELSVAEEAFGGWKGEESVADIPQAAADLMPDSPASARIAIVPREGAAQSELRIGHLAARRDTPDYAPLVVMNALLGGQFVSRINLKLREEKAFTLRARAGFDWRRGLGPFSMQASVHTAATAEAIAIAQGVRGYSGARPPTEQELRLPKVTDARIPANFETATAGSAVGGSAGAVRYLRYVLRGVRAARQCGCRCRREHASRRRISIPGKAILVVAITRSSKSP